ncbi:hypothetical protein MFUM_700026 [Methylacidiphilum fumariolicum SolV]|uniref:Uncharacterized protein n=2 Tax=Candidatus Methylacidiphilum fumarolicum TaxID=591154 RepID=I0JZ08_METFB|nr:conserved protein of unknown function [Candidatus Methylacidiphilum fumarolicum]CCG92477.1 hypothetical protein MFUM_700026 [Methylacidiphilum fumariolicum SolV]
MRSWAVSIAFRLHPLFRQEEVTLKYEWDKLSQLPFGFIHYSDRAHMLTKGGVIYGVSIAFRLHPLFRLKGRLHQLKAEKEVSIAFRLHPLFRLRSSNILIIKK